MESHLVRCSSGSKQAPWDLRTSCCCMFVRSFLPTYSQPGYLRFFALNLVTLALTRVIGQILVNSCDSDVIDLIDPDVHPVCVPLLKQIMIMIMK